MRKRLRTLAPVAVSAALVVLLSGCVAQAGQASNGGPGYITGDGTVSQWAKPTTAPVEFSGTTVERSAFSSKRYLGRIVVVNFWYAGCPPCRLEAPRLNRLADRFRSAGVQFIGVNIIDNAATAASFERTYKSTYPSILDQEGGASVQLAFAASRPPKAVPSTLVLDRKGRVTSRVVGLLNESVMKTLIQDAIDGNTA